MPNLPTEVPATGARLGPSTAPSVVAHTIKERWRPRNAAGARSTAAYRAWKLAAVAAPNRKNPGNRSGIDPRVAAKRTMIAPAAAIR